MYTNGNLEAHLAALLFLGTAGLLLLLVVSAGVKTGQTVDAGALALVSSAKLNDVPTVALGGAAT